MAKEVNKRINVFINGKEVENNIKSIRSAMIQLTNQLNKMEIGSTEYIETSKKLRELKSIYDEHRKSLKMTGVELVKNSERMRDNMMIFGGFAAAAQGASAALQRFVSATQEYVEAYASLDDAMTGVSKYTGLSREEVKQLNEEFKKMDTRTPTLKLNALAADAGRLGITSKEAIKDFVEAADIINVALGEDLGEDAVKNIGKMAQMFGESETMGLRGAMIATASAVNTLAQSSSASEPFIMDFSARLASVANTAGITQANIMGIASAMDQNMAQVERSATAVQKVMMDMMGHTEKYAKLVGMTSDEFKQLVESDMNAAFLKLLDTFKEIETTSGKSALAEELANLKLKGAGVQDTLLALANNTDKLREAQQLATQAYADGNSAITEAAAVNSNAAAQLEIAKQAVEDEKAALGEELIPVLTQLTESRATGLKILTEIIKFVTQHTGVVWGLIAAYTALYAVKNKKLIADKMGAAQMKINHALKLLSIRTAVKKKVALTAEIAATEAKKLADMKARLETLQGVAADNQMKAVLVQETVAKTANAAATRAQAQAQRLLNAATKATPWGLIAAGITAAVVVITKLVERHREATKAVREFNEECSKEQAEAEYLFGKLKKAEKGTKDYNDALNKLKEAYPDIIQKHLDEEGALRNVEQAYKDVIKQVYAKIAAEKKEAADKSAISDNIETQGRESEAIREKLTKQGIPKSKIENIVTEILNEASSATSYDYGSVNSILRNLETKFGLKRAGQGGQIYSQVEAILIKQVETNEALAKSERIYQPFIDDADELKKLEKELDEADKQYKFLVNNKDSKFFNSDPNAIIDAWKKVIAIQKKIDELKKKNEPESEEGEGDGGGNYVPSGTVDENLADKLKKFEEKVAKMRRKDEEDTLEGWAKIRKKIENDYADVITEAKELYGEDDSGSHVKAIVEQKNQAIAEAGEKYLKDAEEAIKKMEEESQKWLDSSTAKEQPAIMKAVTGTKRQWDAALKTVEENIKNLQALKEEAEKDGRTDNAALYAKALDKQLAAQQQLTEDQAKATLATLQKYIADEQKLLADEQTQNDRARMTERQRAVAEATDVYEKRVEAKQAEIDAVKNMMETATGDQKKALEEQLKALNAQLEAIENLKDNAVNKAKHGHSGNVWEDLFNIDWANFSADWQSNLQKMTAALQEFANAATDIFNSISQIQSNKTQAEFDEWSEIQDEKADRLKRQLDDGLISQAYYDAQMEKLQKEKDEKEKQMKHEQFEREKRASIIQAIIQGALSAATTLAQWGVPWGLIPMALALATTAVQTALIASQPNPYARGGFIRGEQLALMGEQGDEWVASNQLLEDRRTAPLIAALEAYQRGNRRAIDDLVTVEEPRWEKLSQSSRRLSRTFAGDSVGATNIYNTNTNNSVNADTLAVLTELQTMNRYLKDPKNRQAYISRKMQLKYEENENELKEMARL